jgi:hypothetical protein
MWICPNGHEEPDENLFCGTCGTPREANVESPNPASPAEHSVESLDFRFKGVRSGIEVSGQELRLYNRMAKSEWVVKLGDLRGVTYRPPGWGRGWLHLEVPGGTPPPSGAQGGVDPYAVMFGRAGAADASRLGELLRARVRQSSHPAEVAEHLPTQPVAGGEPAARQSSSDSSRGCLIAVIVVVVLLVLGAIFAAVDDGDDPPDNVSPAVITRIDNMTSCSGLQAEFDTADVNGNADLMSYIDARMNDVGCYG